MPGGFVRESLTTHWWRAAPLVVATGLVACGDGSVFGLLPIALWCLWLGRTRRTGLIVGGILLVLLAWFVVPRALWWSGPLVPSPIEAFWLYALLTAFVCVAGAAVERRELAGVFSVLAVVGLGLALTAIEVIDQQHSQPGWEGVLPGPSGVLVAERDGRCDSGYCWRAVDVTGDRARVVCVPTSGPGASRP